jgi:hypothetical protein
MRSSTGKRIETCDEEACIIDDPVLTVRYTENPKQAISDEMRDLIETEWPDIAAKLLPGMSRKERKSQATQVASLDLSRAAGRFLRGGMFLRQRVNTRSRRWISYSTSDVLKLQAIASALVFGVVDAMRPRNSNAQREGIDCCR